MVAWCKYSCNRLNGLFSRAHAVKADRLGSPSRNTEDLKKRYMRPVHEASCSALTDEAAIDSPPVQHSLWKQPRGPWRKQAEREPQTTRDTPRRVQKTSINETFRKLNWTYLFECHVTQPTSDFRHLQSPSWRHFFSSSTSNICFNEADWVVFVCLPKVALGPFCSCFWVGEPHFCPNMLLSQ